MATSATLTLAELKDLETIALGGRSRTYKPELIDFVHSGEAYRSIMDREPWKHKKVDSVYNSFNNNLKALRFENPEWPDIQVVKKDTEIYLVNLPALQGRLGDD